MHPLENAAFSRRTPTADAIGATIIDPNLLTSAEKLQYESYLRREETNAAIVALAKEGLSIKQIVNRRGVRTPIGAANV